MPVFRVPDGSQIVLKSPTGDVLTVLSDNDNTGTILDARVTVEKIGGVRSFSFSLPKTFSYPITRNTLCFFWVSGVLWFSGYVKESPLQDETADIMVVEGEGFAQRLRHKIVSSTHSAQTLDTIVKAVAQAELGADVGVYYDVAKISVPALSGLSLTFEDEDLWSVLETLLQICNYDYDNAKYRFYVDNEQELVFEQIATSTWRTIFEGKHFQSPDVSRSSSKLVNKILAYRATVIDPKVLEFVSTFEDTESQERFGLAQKKIVFPAFVDTTSVGNICTGILSRRSTPVVKIETRDISLITPAEFGDWLVASRRDEYWLEASDCNTLAGWDDTALIITVLSLSTERTLTGRRSMKFVTQDGSAGEYAELTLSSPIPFPKIGRSILYFAATTPELELRFEDSLGNFATILFGRLELDLWVDDEVVEDQLTVDTGAGSDTLSVNFVTGSIVNQWVRLASSQVASLVDIVKIRLTILGNSALTFYLDRLDAQASSWNTRRLQLEEARYKLRRGTALAELAFGEPVDNVLTELDEQVEDGDVALAVVAKQ